MRILASDIGGTNARFAVFDLAARGREPVLERTYGSREFRGLVPAVERFLSELDEVPELASLAVAGPVADGECEVPNLDWEIRAADVQRKLGIPDVRLINDFDAIGHGLAWLREEDIAPLQEGEPEPGGPVALIGAGTGLGQGFLVSSWDTSGSRYRVHVSEGGHVDFAPRDPLEARLFLHLRNRFGRVSYERVVSGPGLVNVYRFLAGIGYAPESGEVRREMAAEDPARVISRRALARSDALCEKSLDIFVSAYGAQAGNLALTVHATGGVYIAGGIAPHILPKLRDGTFLAAFRRKGRVSEIVERAPVNVVLYEDVGLVGAAAAAEERPAEERRAQARPAEERPTAGAG